MRLTLVAFLGVIVASSACSVPDSMLEDTHQFKDVQRQRQRIEDRIRVGLVAGVEEARRRGAEDLPTDEELASMPLRQDGELLPVVKEYAFDGDGNLRGEGASMEALQSDLEQSLGYLDEARDSPFRHVMLRVGGDL